MFRLLKTVRATTAVTVLHITHSFEEAKRLADLHLYLKNGEAQVIDRTELDCVQQQLRESGQSLA